MVAKAKWNHRTLKSFDVVNPAHCLIDAYELSIAARSRHFYTANLLRRRSNAISSSTSRLVKMVVENIHYASYHPRLEAVLPN